MVRIHGGIKPHIPSSAVEQYGKTDEGMFIKWHNSNVVYFYRGDRMMFHDFTRLVQLTGSYGKAASYISGKHICCDCEYLD